MYAIEGDNSELKRIIGLMKGLDMKNISEPWDNIIIGDTILHTGEGKYYFGTTSANWNRQVIFTIKNLDIYNDKGRD